MTSFPLCTCRFKSPGPGGPVPRVGLGEAGQLRVGGSFVSSQGPPGVRARLGKLQQRPTMASVPPWAASEQGLAGRPLGAPVISCAGCGAPGQPQWAGSGAGHLLLPGHWALRVPVWPPERGSTCGQPESPGEVRAPGDEVLMRARPSCKAALQPHRSRPHWVTRGPAGGSHPTSSLNREFTIKNH